MRMVFLSKQHLKVEEYQRSIQNTSLVANITTNKEYSKQKKFLHDLLEITRDYVDFVLPEDLIYVAVHMINNENFFPHKRD